MNIDIEPFVMNDYEAVIALWKSSDGVGLSEADSPESIAAYLDRNPGMSFVARSRDRIIGAVLAGHDGRRGYLHHLAVAPDYRKRGLGRLLVEACLSRLSEIGITKAHLFIFRDNLEGRSFWEATGWDFRDDIGIMSIRMPVESAPVGS